MKNSDGSWKEDIQCIVQPTHGKGGIYISNIEAASNPRTLARFEIGAVITACKGKNLSEILPMNIEYLYIPAIDHQSFDLKQYFQVANEMLEEETRRTNVLVHCMAGVSRSATLVIAHLMASQSLKFKEAYQFVKNRRKIISPNSSFLKQLQQYEVSLSQTSKKLMAQSTSSSWYSKTSPKSKEQEYDKYLRNQIKALLGTKGILSK